MTSGRWGMLGQHDESEEEQHLGDLTVTNSNPDACIARGDIPPLNVDNCTDQTKLPGALSVVGDMRLGSVTLPTGDACAKGHVKSTLTTLLITSTSDTAQPHQSGRDERHSNPCSSDDETFDFELRYLSPLP